jgi:hypothetical protein
MFISLAPMGGESASSLTSAFKETIGESSKSEFSNHSELSDIEKIYCCTWVTAVCRTVLEEYCINYIIPQGAPLTLKCLMRLAKDLNKEKFSCKDFLKFIVAKEKKFYLTSPFAHDERTDVSL